MQDTILNVRPEELVAWVQTDRTTNEVSYTAVMVERVSPTGLISLYGWTGVRFDQYGKQRGENWTPMRIVKMTPEIGAKIELAERRKTALLAIRSLAYAKLTIEEMEAIATIVNTAKQRLTL
jgi:hypothetical protein